MKFFSRMAIAPRLLSIIGVLIAGLLVAGFAVVISEAGSTVSHLSEQSATEQAGSIAEQLTGEIGLIEATVRSMSSSISVLHQSGVRDRSLAVAVLRPNSEASPLALASWFFEEPLAFDGRAAPGQAGSTPAGAFMPYWIHKDGAVKMEPDTEPGLYSADYYRLSRQSGRAAITEPYVYHTGGKTITMTSITYPVKSGGRMIGVAGIDVALTDISERFAQMHPFGTGRVMLLSNGGLWVAHPNPALRMKAYGDAGADQVKQALATGEVKQIRLAEKDGAIVRIIRPIRLTRLSATWAVVIDVPTATLGAPATRLAWELVIVGLLVLTAVMVGLFFAVRAVVGRPMTELSSAVDGLAKGEERSVPHLERQDEIGTLARASDVFRQSSQDRAAADARSAAEQQLVVDSLSRGLHSLSEGDLTNSISADFPQNYVGVKAAFNKANEALRELIGRVSQGAASIRAGSGEIAQASEDLARRTESNAASLEEASASLTQMDGRLKASAAAAARTAECADQAIRTVSSGRAVAEEAVQAMGRVSESAKSIDGVVEGLDKIAFQTRVLAMNAAVEAGRAGEAGRGFAVVADLVSALAIRAEEEAKQAKDQLTSAQSDIVTAVQAVQNMDGALADISGDVNQVCELVDTMASDNLAQSAAITQIAEAVSAMDHATQQNAAMVEETSAAARSLTSEVLELAEQAGRFRIKDGSRHEARHMESAVYASFGERPSSRRFPVAHVSLRKVSETEC